MIEDIQAYLDGDNNIERVRDILERQGFDVAYGDTYSINEIHKAVMDGCPSIVFLKGNRLALVVGENPDSLLIKAEGNDYYEAFDSELLRFWTGKAVIVLDKNKNLPAPMEHGNAAVDNSYMVIFNGDLDNWDVEFLNLKEKTKLIVAEGMQKIPVEMLPPHPVILTFQKPSKDDEKKRIRAYSKGVEIYILDPSIDPVGLFCHELGHVYWRSRLTKEDHETFEELRKKLDKKNLPLIFVSEWGWKDNEELFCTIYMWYLEGYMKHPGYLDILLKQYPTAYNAIDKIFNRIRNENEMQSAWEVNKPKIVKALNHVKKVRNRKKRIKVGKRLIKAANIMTKDVADIIKSEIVIPLDFIDHELVVEYENKKWILIKSDIFENELFVLRNNNSIDFRCMLDYNNKIPVIKKMTPKNRKPYDRVYWKRFNG